MADNLQAALQKDNMKALFITNALGFAGDLDAIRAICKKNNVLLLEDNCEALGTELEKGKTGNFGEASTFSFFVAHHMSTIEGGMICTDDLELEEMLRVVRANGWDRNLTSVQQVRRRKQFGVVSEFFAKYTFYDLGYNLRPTEITGFLGLYQLQFIQENIDQRERNYLELEAVAKQNGELIPLSRTHLKVLSSFSFPIVCKTPALREKYMGQFSGAGIEIRPMIAGNIERQPFFKKYNPKSYNLEGAEFLHNNSFYCGNYPELTSSDMEVIKSCLVKYE
jgi:CDP-6-deoxy-D-xylo-4-hexulose-3-dehydrase